MQAAITQYTISRNSVWDSVTVVRILEFGQLLVGLAEDGDGGNRAAKLSIARRRTVRKTRLFSKAWSYVQHATPELKDSFYAFRLVINAPSCFQVSCCFLQMGEQHEVTV